MVDLRPTEQSTTAGGAAVHVLMDRPGLDRLSWVWTSWLTTRQSAEIMLADREIASPYPSRRPLND
jgi:hypothetical protein